MRRSCGLNRNVVLIASNKIWSQIALNHFGSAGIFSHMRKIGSFVESTLFSQETRNQSNVQCRTRHWTSGSTFRFRRSVRIGQSGFVSVQFSTQRFFPEIRCIKTKSVLEGCHLDWSVRPKTLKNGLSDGTGLSCSGSGRDFLAKIVQSGSWDDSQAHPANPDWTWMSDPGKTGRFFPDFFLALQCSTLF